ncbi:hypothetical protein [Candidatus Odyssella thessalonicensis]|uniref:hypothetical protein n=1 Tax=Candidatus Odyssella thessalonicensis TaxID=84647 RepID=UPI0004967C0C|nr:hypothetical protein [Candidatus Odyssella thessalonicensis]
MKSHLYLSSSLILSLFAPLPSSTAMEAPAVIGGPVPEIAERGALEYAEFISLFEQYPINVQDITEAREQNHADNPNSAAQSQLLPLMDKRLIDIPEFRKFFIGALGSGEVSKYIENHLFSTPMMQYYIERVDAIFRETFLRLYQMAQDDLQQTRLASSFSKLYFISFISYLAPGYDQRSTTSLFSALLLHANKKQISFARFLLSSPNINVVYNYLYSEGITKTGLDVAKYNDVLEMLQADWDNEVRSNRSKEPGRALNNKRQREEEIEKDRQQPNGQDHLPQPAHKKLKVPSPQLLAQPGGIPVPPQPTPAALPPVPQHAPAHEQAPVIIPDNIDPRIVEYHEIKTLIKKQRVELAESLGIVTIRKERLLALRRSNAKRGDITWTMLQISSMEGKIQELQQKLTENISKRQSLKEMISQDSTLTTQYQQLCRAQKGNTPQPQRAPSPPQVPAVVAPQPPKPAAISPAAARQPSRSSTMPRAGGQQIAQIPQMKDQRPLLPAQVPQVTVPRLPLPPLVQHRNAQQLPPAPAAPQAEPFVWLPPLLQLVPFPDRQQPPQAAAVAPALRPQPPQAAAVAPALRPQPPKAAAAAPAPRPQLFPRAAVPAPARRTQPPQAAAVPPAPRPQPPKAAAVPPAAAQQIQVLGAPPQAVSAATIALSIEVTRNAKGEVCFINKFNNTRFYGDYLPARSANEQQRQELREIIEHLFSLAFAKKISQENFAIAYNVIDVIGTALKENKEICQDLYNKFIIGKNYLQYTNDPRIILHFELSDMQAQDRIPAIYNTLSLAYKFALEHNLLEDFFTHAFLEKIEGYGCLDAAQKFIINWLETTMEKIKRRTEINMQPEPATEEMIYRTIQEVYEAAKVQNNLDCLGGKTFAQYEQELRRNYSDTKPQELTLQLEEAKSKMIASLKEVFKAKVFEQLEELNYIPDPKLIEDCWQTIFPE